jgi:hypothetical protein
MSNIFSHWINENQDYILPQQNNYNQENQQFLVRMRAKRSFYYVRAIVNCSSSMETCVEVCQKIKIRTTMCFVYATFL